MFLDWCKYLNSDLFKKVFEGMKKSITGGKLWYFDDQSFDISMIRNIVFFNISSLVNMVSN